MSLSNHKNRRLPTPWGCFINRNKPMTIRFAGKSYEGYEGDTIASVLAANGRLLLSRSFKYHRPRGILSMAGHDANSLVQIGDEPNVRADLHPISNGMEVTGQNFIGSLDYDLGACMQWLSRFMPVGFYYKTFFRPRGAWPLWEKIIRRAAGLGKVNTQSKRDENYKQFMFADVAVIGGGPSGLSAALQAAQSGAEVILIDNQPLLGGALNFARFDSEGLLGRQQADKLIEQVSNSANITVLTSTTCSGWFADNLLSLMSSKHMIKLRAKAVVAATGLIEQPAVFRNNDLPGVMLGSAAQRLLHLYAAKPGTRAVVLTNNTDGYGVALDLFDAGVEVAAIVDLRPSPEESIFTDIIRQHSIKVILGATVFETLPSKRNLSVVGAKIAKVTSSGVVGGDTEHIDCDLICMSVGYAPAAQLLCHSGGTLIYDDATETLVVDQLPDGGRSAVIAGSINNCHDFPRICDDGKRAGWEASKIAGFDAGDKPQLSLDTSKQNTLETTYPQPIFPHPKSWEFIDFDEDIKIKDILNAVKEGYDDLELTKRYTTAVMGPSQGRHSALNTLRLACQAKKLTPAGHVITTQRPPCFPEKLEYLAGTPFEPVRLTPMHDRHLELGAKMQAVGAWLRPAYYGDYHGQEKTTIQQEALNVRSNVGLVDVSTLGKLEIRGTDAAEFVNRMYTFAYMKQPVGRIRYTLMTDEVGTIVDDGVACRLNEQHFYLSATTGGVDAVYRTMLRWNAEWQLDVDIANVTSTYAAVNLVGPNSRKILQSLTNNIDVSAEAFRYLEIHEGHIADIPARLMRIGFVGELGFEIHVPAGEGEALWDILLETGQQFAIQPFGVEAQRLLRLEKGHIIVNQDTNGLTYPHEVNMTWAVASKKPFFIGKRPLAIRSQQSLQQILVGFTLAADSPLPEECNLTIHDGEITGYVTSIVFSSTIGKIIGLAFVAPKQKEPGSTFDIKLNSGNCVQATVVPVPFYDPEAKRQEM